jgi:hypothetical protein
MSDLQSVLDELSVGLDDLFECMEIAEDEISKAMNRHPQKRYLIYGSFLTLKPVAPMPMKLYRAHCRELLDRIGTGEDYQPVTRAEVLSVLNRAAWAIPLHNEPSALYYKLFASLFPDAPELEQIGAPLAERYEGETDNLYREICDVMARKIKRDAPYERIPYSEQEHEPVEVELQQMPLFQEAS